MTKKTNYCTFSPDIIKGVYIGDLCKWHDNHYQLDKKIYSRKEVDKLFKESLKARLPENWKWISNIYYISVRLFCKASWQRWNYYWLFNFIPIRRINWKKKSY